MADADKLYRQEAQPGIDPFMTLSFASLPVIPTLRLRPSA